MDQMEIIIEAIKKRDVLWNLRNRNYKNIKVKANEWKAIAEELRLPVDILKKKWRSLRDNYSRNLAKKSVCSQEADEDIELSGKYSAQMEFLREHLKRRSQFGNCAQSADDESQLSSPKPTFFVNVKQDNSNINSLCISPTFEDFDKDTFPTPCSTNQQLSNSQQQSATLAPLTLSVEPVTSNKAKRQRKESDNMENTLINTLTTVQEFMAKPLPATSIVVSNPSPAPSNSEDELFCRSLMQKMASFPLQLRNDTKLEMLRYLNAVEVDWLGQLAAAKSSQKLSCPVSARSEPFNFC